MKRNSAGGLLCYFAHEVVLEELKKISESSLCSRAFCREDNPKTIILVKSTWLWDGCQTRGYACIRVPRRVGCT